MDMSRKLGAEFIGADPIAGGADPVAGFSVANGDRISIPGATSATISAVLSTAASGSGATTITFGSGSTLTLAGITHIDSSFFA